MNKPDVTELNLEVLNSNDEMIQQQYNQLKEFTYWLESELESWQSSYKDLTVEHNELRQDRDYWQFCAEIPEDEREY